MTFWWLNPVLSTGASRPLQPTDIPPLALAEHASSASTQWRRHWVAEEERVKARLREWEEVGPAFGPGSDKAKSVKPEVSLARVLYR